jgi:hypothetical protein
MSIFNHFQHITLTSDQQMVLENLEIFLNNDFSIFILKGYAGSGKTTLLKGLVDYLKEIERKYQLMAPTGRAAKVINQKTGFEATTIHKGIYSFEDLEEIESKDKDEPLSFIYYYKIRNNPDIEGSILIIDEASMVSDNLSQGEFFRFGSGYLLSDILSYSRILNEKSKTKIIFIGDPAQLPPIGMNFSPAMEERYLQEKYKLKSESTEMKEVKRQASYNGILISASKIRKCLTSGFFNDFDLIENGKDIFNPNYESFLDTYKSIQGIKVIIAFKNKTALDLNMTIRNDRFGDNLPIQQGDMIIVGSNNYRLGIMNGEFGVVSNVEKEAVSRNIGFYKKDGGAVNILLAWRQIDLIMPDEKGQSKIVVGYMLENFLCGDNYLKPEEQQALYIDFKNRHPKLKSKTEEFKEAIKTDPYFNCILLKYGYAVTCHKAQGGEWENAFVFWDKGSGDNYDFYKSEHNKSGKTNPDFYRWAYTAITRASECLFCINPPYFNSFSGIKFIDIEIQNAYKQLIGEVLIPIELNLKNEYYEILKKYNLLEVPLSIQDHFLRIYYLTQNQYIDIINWEQIGYEIRFYFRREEETAAFKFWVNGQNVFKNNFQKLHSATNSDSLFDIIAGLVKNPVPFIINRNIINTAITKLEFEINIEEEKPFLKMLFDVLKEDLIRKNIIIETVEHHNYRERYLFVRNNEKAIVDFEYNGDGFFGRAFPIENHCNSESLLSDIKLQISNLQQLKHVI